MNIGVFIGSIAEDIGGGFTFQDVVIKRFLQNLRPQDTYYLFYFGNEIKLPQQENLKLIRLRRRFSLLYLTAPFIKTLRSIKGLPTDDVNNLNEAVKEYGIDLMWFVTPSAFRVDCPYIFTIWDLEHRKQPYFPEVSENGEYNRREKYYTEMIGRAARIIVPNPVGQQEVHFFYRIPKERIVPITHPTPTFENPSQDKERNINTIFYPAQMWPHKNHITLFKAVGILKQKGVQLNLILTGSDKGNSAHLRREAKELGIQEMVGFRGFVTREELRDLYLTSTALVYPSTFGPENLPPLEAFALGCPVIAADIAGAKEQLGNGALLFDPLDEVDLSEKIQRIFTDEEKRKALITAGHELAKRNSDQNYVDRVIDVIEEVKKLKALWA